MLLVGIRPNNLPAQFEFDFLKEFLRRNFPGNRVEEIKLAFEMAIAGKLDMDSDEVKSYENFSCEYVSRILNAYRAWSAEAYRQTVKDPPEQKIYTKEELDNYRRRYTENAFQRMRKGRQNTVPDIMKEVLIQDGFVENEGQITDFLVKALGKGIKNLYTTEKQE